MKITLKAVRGLFRPRSGRGMGKLVLSMGLLLGLMAGGSTAVVGGPTPADSTATEMTRSIALALAQYAEAHGGKYPAGSSSTAVFQKLLDGNYVTDPATFYLVMPGKTPPTGTHLEPQNVCYDVTAGVETGSPGDLPVVYVTGFRLEYQPGGHATSLTRPFPAYAYSADAGMKWLTGGDLAPVCGLPVADKAGDAQFRQGQAGKDGYGVVANVVPPDFDARGNDYRQLTPAGPL